MIGACVDGHARWWVLIPRHPPGGRGQYYVVFNRTYTRLLFQSSLHCVLCGALHSSHAHKCREWRPTSLTIIQPITDDNHAIGHFPLHHKIRYSSPKRSVSKPLLLLSACDLESSVLHHAEQTLRERQEHTKRPLPCASIQKLFCI